jgi:hypothetical protein
MISDLIVNSPFVSRHPTSGGLITENIPQSIRALRAAPGFLKIDCLLNASPRSFTSLHRARRGASPKLRSLEWNKRDVAPRTRRHVRADRHGFGFHAGTLEKVRNWPDVCFCRNCNHGCFSHQISSISAVARTPRRVTLSTGTPRPLLLALGATVCFSRLELTLHGSPAVFLAAGVVVLPLHTRH